MWSTTPAPQTAGNAASTTSGVVTPAQPSSGVRPGAIAVPSTRSRSSGRRSTQDDGVSTPLPSPGSVVSASPSASFHGGGLPSTDRPETFILITPEGLFIQNAPLATESGVLQPETCIGAVKSPRLFAKALWILSAIAREAAAVRALRIAEEPLVDTTSRDKERERTRERWLRAEVDGETDEMAVRALVDANGRRVYKVSPVSHDLELVLLMQSISKMLSGDPSGPIASSVILSGVVRVVAGPDAILNVPDAASVVVASITTSAPDGQGREKAGLVTSGSRGSGLAVSAEDDATTVPKSSRKAATQAISTTAIAAAAADAAAAAAEREVSARARMERARAEAETEAQFTAALATVGIDINHISLEDRAHLLTCPDIITQVNQLMSATGPRGFDSDGDGAEDAPDSDFEDNKSMHRVTDMYFRPLDAKDMLRIGRFLPAASAELLREQQQSKDGSFAMTSEMYEKWLAMESYTTTTAGIDPSFAIPPLGQSAPKDAEGQDTTPLPPSSFDYKNISMLMGLSRRRRQRVDPYHVEDWSLDEIITSAQLGADSSAASAGTTMAHAATVVGIKRDRRSSGLADSAPIRLTVELHRHWGLEASTSEMSESSPTSVSGTASKSRRGSVASARVSAPGESGVKKVKQSKSEPSGPRFPDDFVGSEQSAMVVEFEVDPQNFERAVEVALKERQHSATSTGSRRHAPVAPSPKQLSPAASRAASRSPSPAPSRARSAATTPLTNQAKAQHHVPSPSSATVSHSLNLVVDARETGIGTIPGAGQDVMESPLGVQVLQPSADTNSAMTSESNGVLALSADVVPYNAGHGQTRQSPVLLSQINEELGEDVAEPPSPTNTKNAVAAMDKSHGTEASPMSERPEDSQDIRLTMAPSPIPGGIPSAANVSADEVAALAGTVAFRSCPTPRPSQPRPSPAPTPATAAPVIAAGGRGRASRRLIREEPAEPPTSKQNAAVCKVEETNVLKDVSNSVVLAQVLPTHGIRVAFNSSALASMAAEIEASHAFVDQFVNDSQLAKRVAEILLEEGVHLVRAAPISTSFFSVTNANMVGSERLQIDSDIADAGAAGHATRQRSTRLTFEAPLQTPGDVKALVEVTNQMLEPDPVLFTQARDAKSCSSTNSPRGIRLKISDAEAWGPLYLRTVHAREEHLAWLESRQAALNEKKRAAKSIAYRRARAELCQKLQQAVANKQTDDKEFPRLLRASLEAEVAADAPDEDEFADDEMGGGSSRDTWTLSRDMDEDSPLTLSELALEVFSEEDSKATPNPQRAALIEAAVQGDEVLALLIHAQQRLARQVALNAQRRERLRQLVRLRHAAPPIRIRESWMHGVVTKCLYIGAWQTLRFAFAKGTTDVPVPLYIAHEISLRLKRAHAISTLRKLQAKNQLYSSRLASLEYQLKQQGSSATTSVVTSLTQAIELTLDSLKQCHEETASTLALLATLGEESTKSTIGIHAVGGVRSEKGVSRDNRDFSACGVCFSLECTESNPLIICEICAIAVHKVCYGLSKIPDNDWVCQYCKAQRPQQASQSSTHGSSSSSHHHGSHHSHKSKSVKASKHGHDDPADSPGGLGDNGHPQEQPPPTLAASGNSTVAPNSTFPKGCRYCPVAGGCLKPAEQGGWAHIVCAFWIPGLRIGDVAAMEPICGGAAAQAFHAQSKARYGAAACICGVCCRDVGLTTKCAEPTCTAHFHPLCSWYAGFYMRARVDGLNCHFSLYCPAHTPIAVLSSETPYTGHLPDPLPLTPDGQQILTDDPSTIVTVTDPQKRQETNPNAILRPRPAPVDPVRAAAIPPCPSTGAASVDYARLFALLYPSRSTSKLTRGVTTRGMLFPAMYAMSKMAAIQHQKSKDSQSPVNYMPSIDSTEAAQLVSEGWNTWLRSHPSPESIRVSELTPSLLAQLGQPIDSIPESQFPMAADAAEILRTTKAFPAETASVQLHRALVEFRLMTQQAMRRRGRLDPATSVRRSRKLARSTDRHAKLQLARLQREDTYEPNRCAICFCDEADVSLEREARLRRVQDMDEVYTRQLLAYRQAYEQQQAIISGIRRKYVAIGSELLHKQQQDARVERARCQERMEQILEKAAEATRAKFNVSEDSAAMTAQAQSSDDKPKTDSSPQGSSAVSGAVAAAIAAAKNSTAYRDLKARCTELESMLSQGGQSQVTVSNLPAPLRRKYLEEVARLGPPLQPLVYPNAANAAATSSSALRVAPPPSVQYAAALERKAKLYGQDLLLHCSQCGISVHQSCAGVTLADLEQTAQLMLASTDGSITPFQDGATDSPTSAHASSSSPVENVDQAQATTVSASQRQIPFIIPDLIPIVNTSDTGDSVQSTAPDAPGSDGADGEHANYDDHMHDGHHHHSASSSSVYSGPASTEPINMGPGSLIYLLQESPAAAKTLLAGWRCRRCTHGEGTRELSCAICPRRGGAFTRIHAGQIGLSGAMSGMGLGDDDYLYSSFTGSIVSPVASSSASGQLGPASASASSNVSGLGRWIHVACAIWHPECVMRDPAHMDQVDGLRLIPRARRILRCTYCQRPGPCITCSFPGCHIAFHPLCAHFARCRLSIAPELPSMNTVTRIALCRAHTPLHLIRGALIPAGHAEIARARMALASSIAVSEAQRRLAIAHKVAVRGAIERVEALLKAVLMPFVPAGTDVLSRDVYAGKLRQYYVEQVEHATQVQLHIQQQIQHQIQAQHQYRAQQSHQQSQDSEVSPQPPQPPVPPAVPTPPFLLTHPATVLTPEVLSGAGNDPRPAGLARVIPRHLQWPEEALAIVDPDILAKLAASSVDIVEMCAARMRQDPAHRQLLNRPTSVGSAASTESSSSSSSSSASSSSSSSDAQQQPPIPWEQFPGLYLDDVAAHAGVDIPQLTNPALLVLARALAASRRSVQVEEPRPENAAQGQETTREQQQSQPSLVKPARPSHVTASEDVIYADLYSSWAPYPHPEPAVKTRAQDLFKRVDPSVMSYSITLPASTSVTACRSAQDIQESSRRIESELLLDDVKEPVTPASVSSASTVVDDKQVGLGSIWQAKLAAEATRPETIASGEIQDGFISRDAVEFELAVRLPNPNDLPQSAAASSSLDENSTSAGYGQVHYHQHGLGSSAGVGGAGSGAKNGMKAVVKATKSSTASSVIQKGSSATKQPAVTSPSSPVRYGADSSAQQAGSVGSANGESFATQYDQISPTSPTASGASLISATSMEEPAGGLLSNEEGRSSSSDDSQSWHTPLKPETAQKRKAGKGESKEDTSGAANADVSARESKSSQQDDTSKDSQLGSKRKSRPGRDQKEETKSSSKRKTAAEPSNVDNGPTQSIGAVIRVKRGGVSVEATVLDAEKRTKSLGDGPPVTSYYYLLHYTGMNKKLDDWVSEAQLKRVLINGK